MDEDGCGTIILLGMLGAIAWFAWLDDSALRYEIQYGAEVTIKDKPHDCEFMTAPLGRKNCSYETEVSTIKWSKDTKSGAPIISYDGGDTWDWNPGGPSDGAHVYIYWVRSED